MTTRKAHGTAIGLLAVAMTLSAGRPLDAGAIGGVNTVVVSPGHGRATVPFQVTYGISPCPGAASLTITFSWGALPMAGQVLGTAATDSACRATLSTTPPVNPATHQSPAAGNYLVFGYVDLATGIPTPGSEASATYTVDVTPAPTATASSSGRSRPSASAPGATASASGAGPAASGQPSVTAAKGAAAQPLGQPGWWTLSWQVRLGATVLALAILAAILRLIAWMRRRRRAREAAGLHNDRAA